MSITYTDTKKIYKENGLSVKKNNTEFIVHQHGNRKEFKNLNFSSTRCFKMMNNRQQ